MESTTKITITLELGGMKLTREYIMKEGLVPPSQWDEVIEDMFETINLKEDDF